MEIQIANDSFPGTIIQTREVSGLRLVEEYLLCELQSSEPFASRRVLCTALNWTCSEVYAGKVRQYEAFPAEFLPPYQSHSLTFPRAETRAFSVDVNSKWLDSARDYSLRLDSSVFCHRGFSRPLRGLSVQSR